MDVGRLRSANGTAGDAAGKLRALAGRRTDLASDKRRALARAIVMDLDADAVPAHVDGAQPRVQALLSRLASCPGVRNASLWTCTGDKLASVARHEDDPLDLGVLMCALRAVADLTLATLEGRPVETLTATAADLRIEMRVLEQRYLLILAVDGRVPMERVQPVVNTTLLALHTTLQTR